MQLLAKHISLGRKLGNKAEQAEAVQGSGLVGLSIPQPNSTQTQVNINCSKVNQSLMIIANQQGQ